MAGPTKEVMEGGAQAGSIFENVGFEKESNINSGRFIEW